MSQDHIARLTGKLLAERAPELQQELAALLSQHTQLCLDLSGVEEIDAMGLQLLLAARVSQRARSCALQFHAPSPVVHELCAALAVQLESA